MRGRWSKQYCINFREAKRASLKKSGLTERECDTWIRVEEITRNEWRSWVQAYLKLLYREIELRTREIKCLKQNAQ